MKLRENFHQLLKDSTDFHHFHEVFITSMEVNVLLSWE